MGRQGAGCRSCYQSDLWLDFLRLLPLLKLPSSTMTLCTMWSRICREMKHRNLEERMWPHVLTSWPVMACISPLSGTGQLMAFTRCTLKKSGTSLSQMQLRTTRFLLSTKISLLSRQSCSMHHLRATKHFNTMAIKVMAYFMLNDRPDFFEQGLNTLEKLTHQYHMHEIYAAAAPIYNKMKENPPTDV